MRKITDAQFDKLSVEEQRILLDEEKQREDWEYFIKSGLFIPGLDRTGDSPEVRSARREFHAMGLDYTNTELIDRYVKGWITFYDAFYKTLPRSPSSMREVEHDFTIPVRLRLAICAEYTKMVEAAVKRGQKMFKADFVLCAKMTGVYHWNSFNPAAIGKRAAQEAAG